LGAGHGALTQRLKDAGFEVAAFDLDPGDWTLRDVACRYLDLNGPLDALVENGPYAAICALEVIEHLENPRRFLQHLIALAKLQGSIIILSTPNPLDTFSCIAMFSRGIFNWFSTEHYEGGGHISILPYWLVTEHIKYVGATDHEWRFLAPYRHPQAIKRFAYRIILGIRHLCAKTIDRDFFDGQTALVVISP